MDDLSMTGGGRAGPSALEIINTWRASQGLPQMTPEAFAEYAVGKPGIDFDPDHPEWDPDHLFAERTAVLHRGTSWRALRPTQGEEPGVVADAWTVLAQGGDTGTIDEAVQAATEAGAAQVALAAEQAGSAATQAASALTSAQLAAQDRAAAEQAAANAQSSALTCATWAVLSGLTGSVAGQGAEVLDSDTGTHTDPVVGGTVPNAGRYTWSASPAGWRRIGDTGLAGKAPLASPALTGAPTAPTAAAGTATTQIATTAFADARAAQAEAETSRAVPLAAASVARNGAFARSRVGSIVMPSTGGNAASYTRIMREIEEWFAWISNTNTFAYPECAIVDGQRHPYGVGDRAIRVRMRRSSAGATRTEVQWRQIYAIPPSLWDRAVNVRLTYAYKIDAAGPVSATTGLLISPNADMSGQTVVAGRTPRTVNRIGEVALATWDVTIPADQGARYFVLGPRFDMAEGVSDVDTYAWLYDVSVIIEPGVYMGLGVEPVEDFGRRLSQADTAPERSRNALQNATFWDNDLGPLAGAVVPQGWELKFGPGGTYRGARDIVVAEGMPLLTSHPLYALRTVEANDGSTRTDNQISQQIALPFGIVGTTDRFATLLFWGYRSHASITLSALAYLQDAAGATLTTPNADLLTPQPPVGQWGLLRYRIRLTDPAAVQMQIRLRSTAGAVIAGDAYALKAGPFVGFDLSPYHSGFEVPLIDEMRRTARRIAVEVVAEQPSPTPAALLDTDRYMDAAGNFLPVVPSREIMAIGDSQTDNLDAALAAALPGRTVIDAGIGGELLATHILNRIRGHGLDTLPSFAASGTKRLRTRRAVPPRCVSETYRAQWSDYGGKIAEPRFVEFYNASGLIGRSYDQLQCSATISGNTLTAAGHPWTNGDQVYVLQASRPANMFRGKVYYARDVSGSTFRLAEFSGGSAVTFDAFAGSVLVLGGWYLDWDFTVGMDTAISLRTYTDWSERTLILNGGTNDIGQDMSAAAIIAAYDSALAEIRTLVKRVVLHTIPGFWDGAGRWQIGGDRYDKMTAVHRYLRQRYGAMLADTYAALLASGDGSANDTADIAVGLVPRSKRIAADDGHINSAGNTIRAATIAALIGTLGW